MVMFFGYSLVKLFFLQIFVNSSLSNASPQTPYLFRNYNLPLHTESIYPGSCQFMTWQAIRATTAAPRCANFPSYVSQPVTPFV
jgi:hypothetical protein